jgi:heparosan-N-sulfate-glucuronate 5-epimerase
MKRILQQSQAAYRELSSGWAATIGRTVDFAPQPLGRQIEPDGLGGYYCDLRHKTRHPAAGMPVEGFGGPEDWVIPIAQEALGYWELRTEGEPVESEFLGLAEVLLENREPGAGGCVWRTDFAVPKYGLGPGWISAMAQGQAISVLLRAHRLSGEERYLEAAREALPPLQTPVSEGGTQSTLDGVTVLEEYPTPRPSAVLNGWIFALWGVHELANVTGEPAARELFQRSAAGLVELLPRYDIGWWSLYSLYDHGRPDLAKPFYQRLHPEMLEGLALITGAEPLRAYARRWRAQDTHLAVARATADKLVFRAARALSSRR